MLELHAGRGGEEAALACAELLRMYRRWAEREGHGVEVIDVRERGNGVRSASLIVSGAGAVERLRDEVGEHVTQRKTRSRSKDRIHTTGVNVQALPLAADPDQSALDLSEVRIEAFRGPGPGGQHRNKTNSAIRATHLPSGAIATVTYGRKQHHNRRRALEILEARVRQAKRDQQDAKLGRLRERGRVAGAVRTYDHVRGMIRDRRYGKSRRLKQILDGDLGALTP